MIRHFIKNIKYKGLVGFYLILYITKINRWIRYNHLSDFKLIKVFFYKHHGYNIDIDNPKTLNEKIQWLKLNSRKPISKILCDKYKVRDYIKKNFGEKYLIPLLFKTKSPDLINLDKLPNYPFIIKANHDSGNYLIVKNKSNINWKHALVDFKWWLSFNYFYNGREWQYKNIPRMIIVEKLLLNSNGKIPNDYKLHFINGNLEFIYVSVDREGLNKRNIYDKDWNPLNFTWAKKGTDTSVLRGDEIKPPKTLNKMIDFGKAISSKFAYVRVDFYDLDGKLFFGEVTEHHGSGFDLIKPFKYDLYYGKKIDLTMYQDKKD